MKQDVTIATTQPSMPVRLDVDYRQLVASVQDYAIFMLNPDGTIASWNAGAAKNKGYSADEIIGKHFPAMALVQVVALVEDRAKVEIEATAVVPAA